MINTKRTKIVCTIGPATKDVEILKKMMLAGMNVARLNFSHGSFEDQEVYYNAVVQARAEVGLPVAILLDTQGPEIRTGMLVENPVTLKAESIFTLVNDDVIGDNTKTSITYKELYKDVEPGTTILIDDGKIELEVQRIDNKDIVCKVMNGGNLGNRKSINVPGRHINLPALKQKDIDDLIAGCEHDFDYIAASFIRSADDVIAIRNVLKEHGGEKIKIISKIESQEGVDNLEEIIAESDGIMVARGDMGVELPMEYVPLVQKRIIKECNKAGKIVITATQMLESMTENPRPTRAEVSDVANAIFDLTGAIMLSGESAMGKYPVECVETMSRIAYAIEDSINYDKRIARRNLDFGIDDYEFYLNNSICSAARQMRAKALFSYTEAGNTPRIISSLLPSCPIIAITKSEKTYRQMALVSDVIPILINEEGKPKELIAKGIEKAKEMDLIETGDVIAIAGGETILAKNDTRMNRTVGGVIFA
ncbi:MAG: pyruvate kinase [Clostridia bacterium]|nr:pyruvate kinase [Clostridia bacterium]